MIYIIFNARTGYAAYTIQDDGIFIWRQQTARGVLKQLCLQNGCTYEGRREAISKALHMTQKIPILVSEQQKDIFFPTRRIRDPRCMWINHRAVVDVSRYRKRTKVTFRDGRSIVVVCDIRSIQRARKRCDEITRFLAQS